MKREIVLKLLCILPIIFAIICIKVIFSGHMIVSDKILFVTTFIVICFEITRLNLLLLKFKNLYMSQKDEIIYVLKHEYKTPAIAQIRAIELLLNGHFGKVSIKQKEIFSIMLYSEKYLYNLINKQISAYSHNRDFILN